MKFIKIILLIIAMAICPITSFAAESPQSVKVYDSQASNTLAGVNQAVTVSPNGYGTATFSIQGTFSGTFIPEVSVDGTNYFAISALSTTSATTTQSITSAGSWTVAVAGFANFRVRESAYVSGNAVVTVRSSASGGNVSCINNCTNPGTIPHAKISIGLGFISGALSTSTQYPVQPVPSYTNGQITGMRAAASTADNGTTVFTLYKNGTSIGTLSFTNGATTASTTFGSPVAVNAGDILTLSCTTAGTATNVGVIAEGQQDSF